MLPPGATLTLGAVSICPDGVTIELQTTGLEAICPDCHGKTSRIHSRYQRTLADLPLAHTPLTIHLLARRFFCPSTNCPRRTFREPLPSLAAPRARRTLRLSDEQRRLGLEIGGEVGARLATRQGMPVSPDTLLRLARRSPQPPRPTPRLLGIDDFALRKGQVYGTILVDLERHQPVDLLPERSADAVATWLGEHPGVEVITRDRSAEYAEAARRGAPDALQVADRFHLLQNLREMLQRLALQHQGVLRAVVQGSAPPGEEPSSAQKEAPTFVPPTAALAPRSQAERGRSQERREQRTARYQRVKELRAQGLSMAAIAEQVHVCRRTVRRYCRNEQFPERSLQRRPSKLDAFRPYLEQRLAAGEDNALQLWRELREQFGYNGASRQVSRWVASHRHLVPAPDPTRPRASRGGRPPASVPPRAPAPPAPLSAHKAAWLLIARLKTLRPDEQQLVERLCGQSPTLATAYTLAQAFIEMVRERKGERFDGWLAQVASSGVMEFQQFARGLERDKAAVAAALRTAYSNGQVEGQVNRLKVIKRIGYGRAKFDLLRQRVLARAS